MQQNTAFISTPFALQSFYLSGRKVRVRYSKITKAERGCRRASTYLSMLPAVEISNDSLN